MKVDGSGWPPIQDRDRKWPLCRKAYPIKANAPHTPTRLYSTEQDPLPVMGNSPHFYPNGGGDLMDTVTYPGSAHSWVSWGKCKEGSQACHEPRSVNTLCKNLI
jgi:hypothetical protein